MKAVSNYLPLAIYSALDAGREIMRIYNQPMETWNVTAKSDSSPLTAADRAAHQVIANALNDTPFPLLSEEGRSIDYEERSTWETFWMVDPLDGTKEFLKRNGEFTVNIALVENCMPVLGVIYVPVQRRLYYGVVGEGAFCVEDVDSDTPMQLLYTAAQPLPLCAGNDHFVVVASRSHLSAETEAFINSLRADHPDLQLRNAGSSLKICLVAEGTANIYPRQAPTMEWDTCAGDAIARAAGCKVLHFETREPLIYNKPDLHNPHFIVCKSEAL